MTDIEKIVAALCAPQSEYDEDKSDEDCGFEFCNPDEDDTSDYDEYENDTSDYDEWYDNTYSAYKDYRNVDTLASRLQDIADDLDNDDHRFYEVEYDRLRECIDDVDNAIDALRRAAGDYSTY